MTVCVLGFLFNANDSEVVLIRKERPDWAKGLLNGVGGHIEEGETPEQAMAREFTEETGFEVGVDMWHEFGRLTSDSPEWEVIMFTASHKHATLRGLVRSVTDEEVSVVHVATLSALPLVVSVRWMIPLALDKNKIAHIQKI